MIFFSLCCYWHRNLLLVLLLSVSGVFAYIPALPTNDTTAVANDFNGTEYSNLDLKWYPNGSYGIKVAYELAGKDSSGVSQGAFVHFSEVNLTNETTTTPWIALVSCDANSTTASLYNDIFTLARDRGAVAAVLYSLHSSACIINSAYADPAVFDQVFDIFSTQSVTTSLLIESPFASINKAQYGDYNPVLLNASFAVVNSTRNQPYPPAAGYMFATLTAFNATPPGENTTTTTNQGAASNGSMKSDNPSLAMIILYAITGCVSALFCVVIASGAIRAIRHPERYGPRNGNQGWPGEPQSRARGLTRAILDTFPVVKFGTSEERPKTDEERDVELSRWEVVDKPEDDHRSHGVIMTDVGNEKGEPIREQDVAPPECPSSSISEAASPVADLVHPRTQSTNAKDSDISPAAIGRETCPICIIDFQEGDDLRVLPCEGKHRFHQECVDQWLLELSSSCPICREDFHALETMILGEAEGDGVDTNIAGSSTGRGRFSRYLRFAKRRAGHRDEAPRDYDRTYPSNPAVVETAV